MSVWWSPCSAADASCGDQVLRGGAPCLTLVTPGCAHADGRRSPGPFESLESAHDYLSLLREALEEAHTSILDDTVIAQGDGAARRVDALRLVEHKLNRLRQHLLASLVLLNDLRTLRRLLLGERPGTAADPNDRR